MDTYLIPAPRYLDLCEASGALDSIAGNVSVTRERLAGKWTVDPEEVVERLARLRRDAAELRKLADRLDAIGQGKRS